MPIPRYVKIRQKVVYWPPIGRNSFGELQVGSPTEIDARWEDINERFLDLEGEERVSNSIIFTDRDVEISGMLRLGGLASAPADPKLDNDSWEIRRVDEIPNLRATQSVWRAMV